MKTKFKCEYDDGSLHYTYNHDGGTYDHFTGIGTDGITYEMWECISCNNTWTIKEGYDLRSMQCEICHSWDLMRQKRKEYGKYGEYLKTFDTKLIN